jgi:hypothetical protein
VSPRPFWLEPFNNTETGIVLEEPEQIKNKIYFGEAAISNSGERKVTKGLDFV